jgi:transposase InsO family protein
MQIELRKLELQQQHELRMRECEFSLGVSAAAAAASAPVPALTQPHFKVEAAVRLVPRFNENDVDAFFQAFERVAQLNAWPQDKYAAVLQAHLTGKGLRVFSELPLDQCRDYTSLKAAVLTAYAVVPEVHRKRFRGMTKFHNETYSDFAFRLSSQFKRWLEGEGAYETVDKLRETLLMEQFRSGLEQDLALWLVDQKPATVTKAAQLADQFVALRKASQTSFAAARFARHVPQRATRDDVTTPSAQADNQASTTATVSSPATDSGQSASVAKPVRLSTPAEVAIRCRYCKKTGHVLANCQKRIAKQRAGSTSQGSPPNDVNLVATDVSPAADINRFALVQPAPACKLSMMKVPPADSRYEAHMITVTVVCPDGTEVQAPFLRDTGALQSLLSAEYFSNFHFTPTGQFRVVRGVTGDIITVPLCEVVIRSVAATGTFYLAVLPSLPRGICGIIGNDLCEEVAVVTRAQARRALADSDSAGQPRVADIVGTGPASTPRVDTTDDSPSPGLHISQLFSEHADSLNHDSFIALQRADPQLRALTAQAVDVTDAPSDPYFFLKANVLMRSAKVTSSALATQIHQVVLPSSLRLRVLQMAHEIPIAGHLGVKKTLARISSHFWWPGLGKSVAYFCKTCDVCQRMAKSYKPPRAELHSLPVVTEPFKHIAIDIVGPLPTCHETGNRFILTVIDLCTHYPEAIPLKDHTAQSVAESLLSVFSHFGCPETLLTDNAPEMISETMSILESDFNIRHVHISAYHPQSNGACEKFNACLKSMLTAVCDKDPKAWDKALPLILFAYREVPVSYLGFSPFEMLFGRPVNGPLMLLKKNVLGKANLTSAKHDVISYICQLRETLQSVLSTVQTQSEAQKQASKTWYDKSARSREYSIGQKVLMLMPCLDRPLHAKYFGPYTVTQRLGPVDYIVQTPDRVNHRDFAT